MPSLKLIQLGLQLPCRDAPPHPTRSYVPPSESAQHHWLNTPTVYGDDWKPKSWEDPGRLGSDLLKFLEYQEKKYNLYQLSSTLHQILDQPQNNSTKVRPLRENWGWQTPFRLGWFSCKSLSCIGNLESDVAPHHWDGQGDFEGKKVWRFLWCYLGTKKYV